ncbi:MAG: hypothetical protein ABJP70_09440 [Erythrobacter sp.]
MVEIIPFLLIIMTWDPAAEQESMQVFLRMHPSLEACEASGQSIAKDRVENPEVSRWAKSEGFAWSCKNPPYDLSIRPARPIP